MAKPVKLKVVGQATPIEFPEHLRDAGRILWRQIQEQYLVSDAGGRQLLLTACEAADRASRARALIEEHGELIAAANGTVRANPACAIERDAWAAQRHALRALNLDVEALRDAPGRPPGLQRGRG
jgi:P27 family predicted phage terminase small subunit